ncbi:hypothetical protein HYV44_00340 [Candidatus Microgenomates bacterium]|nr:hypothetical protein [Candidatus Microgenomates bacterium]
MEKTTFKRGDKVVFKTLAKLGYNLVIREKKGGRNTYIYKGNFCFNPTIFKRTFGRKEKDKNTPFLIEEVASGGHIKLEGFSCWFCADMLLPYEEKEEE